MKHFYRTICLSHGSVARLYPGHPVTVQSSDHRTMKAAVAACHSPGTVSSFVYCIRDASVALVYQCTEPSSTQDVPPQHIVGAFFEEV